MGVDDVRDRCYPDTTCGNETCDARAFRPQWYMLIVRSKQERKVAEGLRANGYEVFLPMCIVRRQWSDRLKTYEAPLIPGHLLCRFSLILTNKDLMVLRTPGVILIYPGDGTQLPIPDQEIERLRRITASQYPVECCELTRTGEIVEIEGDISIRGVLVERGAICRVAIGFDAMGRTVALRIPLSDLTRVDGLLLPHWSLGAL